MDNPASRVNQKEEIEHSPHVVHLPGFIVEEEIGLGDVIKRMTSNFGIRPCEGCEKRAALFNRWLVLTGRHPR